MIYVTQSNQLVDHRYSL